MFQYYGKKGKLITEYSIKEFKDKYMGLDVSVYTSIELCGPRECDFKAFVIDDSWRWKIKNLRENGYYKGVCYNCGLSYSYSTHKRFRMSLCKLVGFDSKDFTEVPEYGPFSELIDFADNEGVLDWEVSEKLFEDFENYKELAKIELEKPWIDFYMQWGEVFKVAKNKGVVVFH